MSNVFDNLLVEKYRPNKLEDMVLSEENRKYFVNIINKKETPNLLLSGDPGIGKTTVAKILVGKNGIDCQYLYINASDESGVDTIRNKVMNFAQTKSFDGKIKIVILDEADAISSVTSGAGKSSAQQALRNMMEEYAANTRFILTCNYINKIIPALQSRCQEISLMPPFEDYVKRCVDILKQENIKVENGNKKKLLELIKTKYPDLRRIINTIQKYVINNELIIPDVFTSGTFSEEVYDMLVKHEKLENIREHIIKNEIVFNNDYHQLLKDLFERVYKSSLAEDKKKTIMMYIAEAMYKHQFVMDKEINCFALIIAISQCLA